jgi:hypothetical protein
MLSLKEYKEKQDAARKKKKETEKQNKRRIKENPKAAQDEQNALLDGAPKPGKRPREEGGVEVGASKQARNDTSRAAAAAGLPGPLLPISGGPAPERAGLDSTGASPAAEQSDPPSTDSRANQLEKLQEELDLFRAYRATSLITTTPPP